MHCANCGKELMGNEKFCDGCGAPVVSAQQNTQGPVNTSNASTAKDTQDNKVIFILSYLGILFFLPLVTCPDSKAGRFHANQGLVLLLTSIVGQIAVSIITSMLAVISWRLWTILPLISYAWAIAILVLMIMGMVNANKGELKPLPVIGQIKLIK